MGQPVGLQVSVAHTECVDPFRRESFQTILETEIQIGLGLLGVNSFSELDKSCLEPVAPVNSPHVFSAFPLLEITEALRGRY